MTTLDPYQIEGARDLAAHCRRGLYDEPGLGKTAQAIRARELAGLKSTLVICPAGVRQVWPYEFRLWAQTAVTLLEGATIYDASAWARGRRDVLICSYEQAVAWQEILTRDYFDLLICDESHYMKSPSAKRTRAVLGEHGDGINAIAGMAKFAWFLTGTPIKNDPVDIWAMLKATGSTKMTYTGFQTRYFNQKVSTFSVKNNIKDGALSELQVVIRGSGMMRTFADVGQQLPPARLDVWPIDGDARPIVEYLSQYPGLSERILRSLKDEGRIMFEDGEHISRLRALIAEAKAPNYARMITEELKSGTVDKLVVMGHHRRALNIILEHLREHKINAEAINGTTAPKERERVVRSFQDDPKGVRVIVGNIQAAGTGITLTAAHRIDMFESSWTPTDNVQAVKRVHRKGQSKNVFVRFVMLQKSFDETVAKIVAAKANAILAITEKDTLKEAIAS